VADVVPGEIKLVPQISIPARRSARNGTIVNLEIFNDLKVVAYLVVGTLSLALLAAWALRRFGTPKE
jgi:hypothetical protein